MICNQILWVDQKWWGKVRFFSREYQYCIRVIFSHFIMSHGLSVNINRGFYLNLHILYQECSMLLSKGLERKVSRISRYISFCIFSWLNSFVMSILNKFQISRLHSYWMWSHDNSIILQFSYIQFNLDKTNLLVTADEHPTYKLNYLDFQSTQTNYAFFCSCFQLLEFTQQNIKYKIFMLLGIRFWQWQSVGNTEDTGPNVGNSRK